MSMSAPVPPLCCRCVRSFRQHIRIRQKRMEQVAASDVQGKSRSVTAPITVGISIDSETDILTITATGLENGKNYKFDWRVTYNYGSGTEIENETGDTIKTVNYEPAIVAKAVLAENSYFDAAVTVINLTSGTVSSKYVYADGYDDAGVLIATAGAPLADLGSMEVRTLTLSFDKPVYSVSARWRTNKRLVRPPLLFL